MLLRILERVSEVTVYYVLMKDYADMKETFTVLLTKVISTDLETKANEKMLHEIYNLKNGLRVTATNV